MPLASKTFGPTIPHPENFHPACAFTERTTFSAANITTDIHFGTWFGEREIGRTQTDLIISPNISLANNSNTCFKSVNDTFLSI